MTGGRRAKGRLVAVEIDDSSLRPAEGFFLHERATAIRDLVVENSFEPAGRPSGSFRLHLSLLDKKLVLDVAEAKGGPVARHILSLTRLRRIAKDYFLICDSYYAALGNARPAQVEAIDMGRRGLHNEGAEILKERLEGKIAVDFETARRLFTLVCALLRKG
jgi:uncharacterized protein (UPF0262 family)